MAQYPGGGDPYNLYRAPINQNQSQFNTTNNNGQYFNVPGPNPLNINLNPPPPPPPQPAPVEDYDYDNNQYDNNQYVDNQYVNNQQYVGQNVNVPQMQQPVQQAPVQQAPQQPVLGQLPQGAAYVVDNMGNVTGVQVYTGSQMNQQGMLEPVYQYYSLNEWQQHQQQQQNQPRQQQQQPQRQRRVVGVLEANSTAQTHTFQVRRGGTFTPQNKFIRQNAQPISDQEKKQWKYVQSQVAMSEDTKKKLKGDQKLIANGLSILMDYDETMGKRVSTSKSYIQLRHTLHNFLKLLSGNEQDINLEAAADKVIEECNAYEKKHKKLGFRVWGKYGSIDQARQIKKVMNQIKAGAVAGFGEQQRKERISQDSYSKMYTIFNEQGLLRTVDNKPQMLRDYEQAEQQGKKSKTLKDRKKGEQDNILMQDWNRYVQGSQTLRNISTQDRWSDEDKKKFVRGARIEELASYTYYVAQNMQNQLKSISVAGPTGHFLEPNGQVDPMTLQRPLLTVETFNRIASQTSEQIKIMNNALSCLRKEMETAELDALTKKTLELNINHLSDVMNGVITEYNNRMVNQWRISQWTDVRQQQMPFSKESVDVPLATRQADLAKEKVKNGPVINYRPEDFDQFCKNAERTQNHRPCFTTNEVEDVTAQETKLANYWSYLCSQDKTLQKEALHGMWSDQDIRRFVAIRKVQEVRRYAVYRLEQEKAQLLKDHYDAQRWEEVKTEIDNAVRCIGSLGQIMKAVETDQVFVNAQQEAQDTLNAYLEEVNDIKFRVKENRNAERNQLRRKQAMDQEIKEVNNAEKRMQFNRASITKNPMFAQQYQDSLSMTDGLDMKTQQGRFEYIKRLKEYKQKYNRPLTPELMTKAEYQALRKKNPPMGLGLLNRFRISEKKAQNNGQLPLKNLYDAQTNAPIQLANYHIKTLPDNTGERKEDYAWVEFTDKNGLKKTVLVYPNPNNHSRTIKWQAANNNKEYGGTCSLSSTAEAINIAYDGNMITTANIAVDQCMEMQYANEVYHPERDSMGETIKKDGEVVMSKVINFQRCGGSAINYLPIMMEAYGLESEEKENIKDDNVSAETIFNVWKEELMKGNTIMTDVDGEKLWQDLNDPNTQLEAGDKFTNHSINVCGVVMEGNAIAGFLVKDTGGVGHIGPDGNVEKDAEGDVSGNYDFVPYEQMKYAIRGSQNGKVKGCNTVVIKTMLGQRNEEKARQQQQQQQQQRQQNNFQGQQW